MWTKCLKQGRGTILSGPFFIGRHLRTLLCIFAHIGLRQHTLPAVCTLNSVVGIFISFCLLHPYYVLKPLTKWCFHTQRYIQMSQQPFVLTEQENSVLLLSSCISHSFNLILSDYTFESGELSSWLELGVQLWEVFSNVHHDGYIAQTLAVTEFLHSVLALYELFQTNWRFGTIFAQC